MNYVKDRSTGKVYNLVGLSDTHCQAIVNALCDTFGVDFVNDKSNYPVLDDYIIKNLEIVGGCSDYTSIEQLPEDLMDSEISFIKRIKTTKKRRSKMEEYIKPLQKYLDDNYGDNFVVMAGDFDFDIVILCRNPNKKEMMISKYEYDDSDFEINMFETSPFKFVEGIIKCLKEVDANEK